MQKSISELELSEKMVGVLKSNAEGLRATVEDLQRKVMRLEGENEAHRLRAIQKENETSRQSEAVVASISAPEAGRDREKEALLTEISLLQQQVATLISQNKDVNAYFSLVVPVLPTENPPIQQLAATNKDAVDQSETAAAAAAAAISLERARTARLTNDLERANETIAALTLQLITANASSGQLDTAKLTIDKLTSQLLAAGALGNQLVQANLTIADLSLQLSASNDTPATTAVRGDEEELLALRSEVAWARRHHGVMRRAVLLLDRCGAINLPDPPCISALLYGTLLSMIRRRVQIATANIKFILFI